MGYVKKSAMANIGKGAVGAAKLTANISKGLVAKIDKVAVAGSKPNKQQ
jgi:septum formation inhibitor-activating ATPase MinD